MPSDTPSSQLKEACTHALEVASQFLNLAAAGIAFVVGVVFSTEQQLHPWLVVGACVIFGLSIVCGLMVRMGAVSDIHKLGSCDVYGQPIKRVAAAQILLFLAGIVLLAGATFRRAFAQAEERKQEQPSSEWILTGAGLTEGISGLALVEQDSARTVLLAVHDNKAQEQLRLSLFTRRAGKGGIERRALAWPGTLPVDLEAICRVPGHQKEFLALTSKGHLFRIKVNSEQAAIAVLAESKVPNAGETTEFESLDVRDFGGRLVACWAQRGDGEKSAIVSCANLDAARLTFGPVSDSAFTSPWPIVSARHLSDMRLTATGAVLAIATTDPGNDGPFASALYIAGRIEITPERIAFLSEGSPTRLWQSANHKVEALEQITTPLGGLIFGSDNENRGGAILFNW